MSHVLPLLKCCLTRWVILAFCVFRYNTDFCSSSHEFYLSWKCCFFCEQFAEKYVSNGNINIFSCSNDVYWNSPLHSFQYELIPEKNWICILNCEIVGSSWKVKDLARINGPKANSIQKCGESCKYKTKCNWNCECGTNSITDLHWGSVKWITISLVLLLCWPIDQRFH